MRKRPDGRRPLARKLLLSGVALLFVALAECYALYGGVVSSFVPQA